MLSPADWPAVLLACVAGALVGAGAVASWRRGGRYRAEPKEEPAPREATAHAEAQRFHLLNETGNVLISVSPSPAGPLPDGTLALFSEALCHLSAVFFAIAGARDKAGRPFSLYNYGVLKRALELHPVFIRVSSSKSTTPDLRDPGRGPILYGVKAVAEPSSALEVSREWLDARARRSRRVLGVHDSSEAKLRNIHLQMWNEASQIHQARHGKTARPSGALGERGSNPEPTVTEEEADSLEVGHVTMYCECLLGVSLVSVKLFHAHHHHYRNSDSSEMAEDTYLYVSPSHLRTTLHELRQIPQATFAP